MEKTIIPFSWVRVSNLSGLFAEDSARIYALISFWLLIVNRLTVEDKSDRPSLNTCCRQTKNIYTSTFHFWSVQVDCGPFWVQWTISLRSSWFF